MAGTTKLLLKESVKHVGKVGDVVEVSSGFARNYLLPQHLAVEPTPGNVKKIEARRQEVERQEREKRAQMEALLKQLSGVEVTMERRSNEQGHLYGAVSATEIAKSLQGQGFNINPEDINLPGRLDRIDTYTAQIKFAEDLTTDVKVWIAPDAESKALMDGARKAAAQAQAEAAAAKEAQAAEKAEKTEKTDKGHKKSDKK